MEISFVFLILLLAFLPGAHGAAESLIRPNFGTDSSRVIDNRGAFLPSLNGTFMAAIYTPCTAIPQASYLCIIHWASATPVWCANRNAPVFGYLRLTLTPTGLSVFDADHNAAMWSTPPLDSPVSAMQLLENGNLVLLGPSATEIIWQSFDYPTDTILTGQSLPAGAILRSGISQCDLADGDYSLSVANDDDVSSNSTLSLRWKGQLYWTPSAGLNVSVYMELNSSGLSLFADSEDTLRLAVLDPLGYFNVKSLVSAGSSLLQGPEDACSLPAPCGQLGVCDDHGIDCSCPYGFRSPANASFPAGCYPENYTLSSSCGAGDGGARAPVSYLGLGDHVRHWSMAGEPHLARVSRSKCQDACSNNCSCLAFLHIHTIANDSGGGSCYLLKDPLGSLAAGNSTDPSGYLKVMVPPTAAAKTGGDHAWRKWVLEILIPIAAVTLSVIVVTVGCRCIRYRRARAPRVAVEPEAFAIPGLPLRFSYEELVAATDGFSNPIGAGGFGVVYKGVIPPALVVAVKMIRNRGGIIQGEKEFCTEVAVIGNVRHSNVVKLRGFCVDGHMRLLVYEYMDGGSVDGVLFRETGQPGWAEREEIAIGVARGLAYLHLECAPRILHLDIKPENILLDENLRAKISDFGLSKLLSGPDQSTLFTMVRGTRGYMAPEWLTNRGISDRTDVYSYGMLLLEIVSGQRNSSFFTDNGYASCPVYIPALALEIHEAGGSYSELADRRLDGRVASERVGRMVRVALCCLQQEPRLRPGMADVVRMLAGEMAIRDPQLSSLRYLTHYQYDSRRPSSGD